VLIGQAEYGLHRHAAGVEVLLEAIEEVRGRPELREERLRLEAQLASTGRYALATQDRIRGRIQALAATLDGATPAERLVRSLAERDAPCPTAAELVRRTTRSLDVMSLADPVEVVGPAAMFLHAGRPAEAAALAARLTEQTREDGSPFGHAVAAMVRGIIALDAGDLRVADAELADAAAVWEDIGETHLPDSCAGWRAQVLGALGAGAEGDAILHAHGMDRDVPELMVLNPLLYARGVFHLEQRRLNAAIRDLRELGRRHEHWGPPAQSAVAVEPRAGARRRRGARRGPRARGRGARARPGVGHAEGRRGRASRPGPRLGRGHHAPLARRGDRAARRHALAPGSRAHAGRPGLGAPPGRRAPGGTRGPRPGPRRGAGLRRRGAGGPARGRAARLGRPAAAPRDQRP